MKNGALYVRVSTDKQEELSPDAQRRLLLEYAKKNDIVISADYIYTENGISGRHADKRPEFQRMIAAAKSEEHPIDVILVWKFSRFARNQEESIVYKSLLKKQCNVDVVSISEPLIEGPFGSLIERIIEWMDEYYSIRLAGEVMRGMTEKARRGGYQATTPLGYQYNGPGTVPTVLEDEAETIRYIYQEYVRGVDRTTIARRLNDMGRKTKRGNLFEKRTVEYILRNPFYVGKIRWNRAPHSAYQDNPDDEIIIADGAHCPIIAPELFNRAKSRLDSEKCVYKARSVSACRHWLSGLVRCPICGASLTYSAGKKSWNCWKYAKGFHRGSCHIFDRVLTAAILHGLEELLAGKDFEYEYRPPAAPKIISRLAELQSELSRIASKEERIRLAYENGIDTLEEYKNNKLRLQKDRKRLEEAIEKESGTDTESKKPEKEEILSRIHTVYDMVASDEVDQVTKGNLMRSLFDRIVYDPKTETLRFYIVVTS